MTLTLNQNHNIRNRYTVDVVRNTTEQRFLDQTGTYFVIADSAELTTPSLSARGAFGAVVTAGRLQGSAVIIHMPGLHLAQAAAIVAAGQPGDLSYIDGCSNSVVVTAARNGDPCLNYLYFPRGIKQTMHTHPSLRIGLVLSGQGRADYLHNGQLVSTVLTAGDHFVLDRHVLHRFCTDQSDMSLMVFHPDSEDGPRDENNPMKTRTYLQ